jgi:hypothetical protein
LAHEISCPHCGIACPQFLHLEVFSDLEGIVRVDLIFCFLVLYVLMIR